DRAAPSASGPARACRRGEPFPALLDLRPGCAIPPSLRCILPEQPRLFALRRGLATARFPGTRGGAPGQLLLFRPPLVQLQQPGQHLVAHVIRPAVSPRFLALPATRLVFLFIVRVV